jgi:hypothetical protein
VLKTVGNIFRYPLWRNVTIAVFIHFSEFGEGVKDGDNFSPVRISWLSSRDFFYYNTGPFHALHNSYSPRTWSFTSLWIPMRFLIEVITV